MFRAFEFKRKGEIGGDFATDMRDLAHMTMDLWLRLSAAIDSVNRKKGGGLNSLIRAAIAATPTSKSKGIRLNFGAGRPPADIPLWIGPC